MKSIYAILVIAIVSILLLRNSQVEARDTYDRVRDHTRESEFDYVTWTLDSLGGKLGQFTSGITRYLEAEKQNDLVRE